MGGRRGQKSWKRKGEKNIAMDGKEGGNIKRNFKKAYLGSVKFINLGNSKGRL